MRLELSWQPKKDSINLHFNLKRFCSVDKVLWLRAGCTKEKERLGLGGLVEGFSAVSAEGAALLYGCAAVGTETA
jgi:hypothetical protein